MSRQCAEEQNTPSVDAQLSMRVARAHLLIARVFTRRRQNRPAHCGTRRKSRLFYWDIICVCGSVLQIGRYFRPGQPHRRGRSIQQACTGSRSLQLSPLERWLVLRTVIAQGLPDPQLSAAAGLSSVDMVSVDRARTLKHPLRESFSPLFSSCRRCPTHPPRPSRKQTRDGPELKHTS
jgi:hypothetical protein